MKWAIISQPSQPDTILGERQQQCFSSVRWSVGTKSSEKTKTYKMRRNSTVKCGGTLFRFSNIFIFHCFLFKFQSWGEGCVLCADRSGMRSRKRIQDYFFGKKHQKIIQNFTASSHLTSLILSSSILHDTQRCAGYKRSEVHYEIFLKAIWSATLRGHITLRRQRWFDTSSLQYFSVLSHRHFEYALWG